MCGDLVPLPEDELILNSTYTRKNIRLKIEYDGSEFCGWQRQGDLPTIQSFIEDSLQRFMGQKVSLYGASRTDSGVHARGQVANFWGDSRFEGERWGKVLNSMLPRSIRILESEEVPDVFHSQKYALSKVYEYRLLNRRCASALDKTTFFYPRPLKWEKIRESLPHFVGTHDFAAFQGAKAEVKTTVRTIYRFDLFEEPGGLYLFQIEGNGFLKQMVRAMMGTLLEIGEGKREPSDIPVLIASRDRRLSGRTAAPEGLCLVSIKYPM